MQEQVIPRVRLKHLREQQGLSQEELADRIGKSVHTIHSWELGRRRPDAGVVVPYAQVLGFTPGTPEFHTFVAEVRGFAQAETAPTAATPLAETVQPFAAWNTPEQRARAKVLREVREIWVEGVLQSSLHGQALIALGLAERTDLIQRAWHDVFPWELRSASAGRPNRLANSRLIDVFDAHQAELLILGAPGAGKTTMLIDLAATLLDRAERDSRHPLPVVFNLASWAEQRLPLAEWLVHELSERHGIAPRISRQWLAEQAILPLLDGLDEVIEDERAACVGAINRFHRDHATGLAITSRVADYDALSEQLRIRSAVVLQPLEDEQIRAYVRQFGSPLAQLAVALAQDEQLRELARLPLLLSMMVLVYQDAGAGTIPHAVSLDQQRRELFDRYIEHVFATRRRTVRTYSLAQTRQWLTWLAVQMSARGQTIMYPDHLQADWLPTRASQFGFLLVDRLASAAVGACFLACGFLALILGYGLLTSASPVYYQALGRDTAVMALLGALIGGLFGGTSPAHQAVVTRRDALVGWVVGGLYFGAIGWFNWSDLRSVFAFAIIGSAVGVFGTRPSLQPRRILPVEPRRWSWQRTRRLLVIAAPSGAIIGLLISSKIGVDGVLAYVFAFNRQLGTILFGTVVAVSCAFAFGYSRAESNEQTVRPNQSVRRSAQSLVRAALTGGVLTTLIFVPVMDALPGAALLGLFGGLIGGMNFGGFAVISHYVLRLAFWLGGVLPWRLPFFLHLCAERILLQRIGGGYRFPHKLLQEHCVERAAVWLPGGMPTSAVAWLRLPRWGEWLGLGLIAAVAAVLLAANPRIKIANPPAMQANRIVVASQTVASSAPVTAGSTFRVLAWGAFPVSSFTGSAGPDGTERGFLGVPLSNNDKRLPKYPLGALLCRIEGEPTWRFCGAQASFTAPRAGRLEFMINHKKTYANEAGFVVRVEVKPQAILRP